MKYFLFVLIFGLLFVPLSGVVYADDLEFESFEEAEAAAQRRAKEYDQKMNEHLQKVHKDWEKQQKDLGESDASPDITKITEP